ncbi:MAG: hypothetical protein AAF993_10620 [Pseudomonadota bacterium]
MHYVNKYLAIALTAATCAGVSNAAQASDYTLAYAAGSTGDVALHFSAQTVHYGPGHRYHHRRGYGPRYYYHDRRYKNRYHRYHRKAHRHNWRHHHRYRYHDYDRYHYDDRRYHRRDRHRRHH